MKKTKLLCVAAGLALAFGSSLFAADGNGYFGAGNGTKESPYWVETAEHLQNVRLFPNAWFIQREDIDVGNAKFTPIGNFNEAFTGHYDGEGHRIRINDLGTTQGSIKLAGLWGFTSNAEIKNLNVEINCSLKLEGRVCLGAITACANNSIISNAVVSSDSRLEVNAEKCLYAGGLVGYSAFGTNVKNCSFEGRIIGRSDGDLDAVCALGGIVGENRTGSTIQKSTFAETASISGTSAIAPAWVGGISGFNDDSTYVCDCHAVVPQSLKPDYQGAKRVSTLINKCNSAGSISGYSSERIAVGGIAGFNVAKISSCLTNTSSSTRGSIVKCEDSPSALIGGIVGDNYGSIHNSAALSTIQMMSDGFLAVGGIAGRNAGILNRCNYFAVNGNGLSSFTALRSYNIFSAISSISARGGIVGINDNSRNTASIKNCRVFGHGEEESIASYGPSRGNYGAQVGIEY